MNCNEELDHILSIKKGWTGCWSQASGVQEEKEAYVEKQNLMVEKGIQKLSMKRKGKERKKIITKNDIKKKCKSDLERYKLAKK